MSEPSVPDRADHESKSDLSTEEYGSLPIEDDPEGTVDPGELAGTADSDDHDLPDPGTQPADS